MGGLTADPEIVSLEALDEAWDIPCDFASYDDWQDVPHGPAKWIVHRVRCTCGYQGAGPKLTCEPCKNLLMHDEGGIKCAGKDCQALFIPARTIVSYIEPLVA